MAEEDNTGELLKAALFYYDYCATYVKFRASQKHWLAASIAGNKRVILFNGLDYRLKLFGQGEQRQLTSKINRRSSETQGVGNPLHSNIR